MTRRAVDAVWHGRSPLAGFARILLWPFSLVFRAGVAFRNALYDHHVLRVFRADLPVIAVGNLTVGGTGKTPVSAWIAEQLRARGARPAIVLRGYGADEPLVHARLNPDVPVVVAQDRRLGIAKACGEGATVVVLDDALQHRRVARSADVVLLSAERGLERARLLPTGPFREPVSSLRRATLVAVTRKTASRERATAVLEEACVKSGAPGAVVALTPQALVEVQTGETRPLAELAGRRVLLITGVGEPELVAAQLSACGGQVELHAYPDHHAFTGADLQRAAAARADFAVCTLKDAVKIADRWPGPAPLWYLSQRLIVEHGEEAVMHLLDHVLASTAVPTQTAGARRFSADSHGDGSPTAHQ